MNYCKKSCVALAILTLSLSGCGGGGNDGTTDDNDRNVTGVWTGALTKVTDTCSSGLGQTITFSHNVTQNVSAVTLLENALTYLGNLVGNDGLSVDASQSTTVSGQTCTDARRVEYDRVTEDNDPTADIDLTITRTCPSGTCSIQYTGTGTRAVAANPSATPTTVPGTTTTPGTTTVSGGCADINPNPAAGTYSGNGGCGISDVAYRKEVQSSETVIILEPFGGNGATTFVINPSVSSSASSRRTDLTVNGSTGNTCSLTCSPPSTFTVTCTKEGGTSCAEKF